jgi:hypothetical protein
MDCAFEESRSKRAEAIYLSIVGHLRWSSSVPSSSSMLLKMQIFALAHISGRHGWRILENGRAGSPMLVSG